MATCALREGKGFQACFFISNENSLKCSPLFGIQLYFNNMEHLEVSLSQQAWEGDNLQLRS